MNALDQWNKVAGKKTLADACFGRHQHESKRIHIAGAMSQLEPNGQINRARPLDNKTRYTCDNFAEQQWRT